MDDWQPVATDDWQPVRKAGGPPSLLPEIGGDITGAIKGAASSVADYLNPFSATRHASYAKQAQLPLGQAVQENLSQIGGVGAGLAAPLTAVGGTIGALTQDPLAHGVYYANKAAGTDLPYDVAKEQAGTALMGLAPKGAGPTGLRVVPGTPRTATELKQAAVDIFQDPSIKSIKIPPADVAGLAANMENDLLAQGFRPTPGSAPGTLAEVQRMTPGPGVSSVSVDDLRSARRALNITAKGRDAIGGATPDANAATQGIKKIDDFLNNIDGRIAEANANYSAGKMADTLDYRNMRAEHRAAKTGSGSNIENTMRQEVDKISNRGLRPEEQAMRDKIVEGTFARNAARKIGKLGFGDGLSMMYHAGLSLPTGGANIPFGIAATGIRKIGEALTRRQIRQLDQMIRSRAPASPPYGLAKTPSKGVAMIAALLNQRLAQAGGVMPVYANQDQ